MHSGMRFSSFMAIQKLLSPNSWYWISACSLSVSCSLYGHKVDLWMGWRLLFIDAMLNGKNYLKEKIREEQLNSWTAEEQWAHYINELFSFGYPVYFLLVKSNSWQDQLVLWLINKKNVRAGDWQGTQGNRRLDNFFQLLNRSIAINERP